MRRGEIWWASLPEPADSEPGYRCPVIIVQADDFNRSSIRTVIAAAFTSNLRLADAPGNVLLKKRESGLERESVVNVSQLFTVGRTVLSERVGRVPGSTLQRIEDGLRQVLAWE